jgi:hypothetical protein
MIVPETRICKAVRYLDLYPTFEPFYEEADSKRRVLVQFPGLPNIVPCGHIGNEVWCSELRSIIKALKELRGTIAVLGRNEDPVSRFATEFSDKSIIAGGSEVKSLSDRRN